MGTVFLVAKCLVFVFRIRYLVIFSKVVRSVNPSCDLRAVVCREIAFFKPPLKPSSDRAAVRAKMH